MPGISHIFIHVVLMYIQDALPKSRFSAREKQRGSEFFTKNDNLVLHVVLYNQESKYGHLYKG